MTADLPAAEIVSGPVLADIRSEIGVPVLTDVIRGQESIEAWPFQELIGQSACGGLS